MSYYVQNLFSVAYHTGGAAFVLWNENDLWQCFFEILAWTGSLSNKEVLATRVHPTCANALKCKGPILGR